MENLLQVQINIVLSIVLVIIFGHAYFNINREQKTNRLFILIIGLTLLTLILEIFSVLLNNLNLQQFMVLHKLVNLIGFIVAPCVPVVGYMFIKEWINKYQRNKIKVKNIIFLPLLINGIAALISYNGGELFYITSENIYKRGPLFFILPCVSYIYFGYNLYSIYIQHKKFTYSELTIFSIFYIVPAVFTSIQLKYSIFLTTWNSTAIIIVFLYIFILNDQAYRDSLTGLENRLAYERYAHNICNKKLAKLSIIYIDIDDFKNINDQYGHYEGDEAIKSFSNLLIESFPLRQRKIIRLGGDEFLIILEKKLPENISDYIQSLTDHVKAYNKIVEKPYTLGFSYGIVSSKNDNQTICKLLEYADQLMYEQKKSKKYKL